MDIISEQEFASAIKLDRLGMKRLASPLMKIMKIDGINKLYDLAHNKQGVEFVSEILEQMGVEIEIDERELKNIPTEGGFIALSNHPYGGVDGLILLKILGELRPDFKLIANFLLKKISNIEQFIIPVNPFENLKDLKYNVSGMKQTLEFLNSGMPVGIFPAGEVSAFKANSNKVTDKEWSPVVGRLVSKSKLPVVPIYFHGSNGYLFNLLGLIHPSFRTAKLPSELLNKKGSTIKVRIGKPIQPKEIAEMTDNAQLLRFLRAKTYSLGSALEVDKFFSTPLRHPPIKETIVAAVDPAIMQREIDKLDANRLLLNQQHFEVYCTSAATIPNILQEIGRLREVTFREVGEGTNNSIDLDEFDLYYQHLFVWDKEAKQLVGAYRIGRGHDIYDRYRKKGFYLHTLFRMDNEFVPILKESLELGRSFIVKEYQQKHMSLFMLWTGIMLYLQQNSEYRYLIGPVSISNNFSKVSQSLIIQYIKKNHFDETLSKHVQPRKQFYVDSDALDTEILLSAGKNSLQNLDKLIAEIEPDHLRIPVLLKKYINQNGKIIAFNIDPLFNNSLDGFLILDTHSEPFDAFKMLERNL